MNTLKRWTVKKKISLILIVTLLLSLTGCSLDSRYQYGRSLYQIDNMQTKSSNELSTITDSEKTDYVYAEEENADFEKLMMDYFKEGVSADSFEFHYTVKNGDDYGIPEPKATIGDARADEATVKKQKEDLEKFYQKLIMFENAELTENERFAYECLKLDTEISFRLFDNVYLYEPFAPMRGIQANLPTNFTNFRFDDKSDVELYINLLGQMEDYFDQAIDFEYEKSKAGYFMSDKVADVVIEQCDEFLKDKKNHFLIQTFNNSLDKMDFLTEDEKEDFKKRNKDAVFESAIPAFENLKKVITELKGTGTNDLGLCYYEGGKDYYSSYIFPTYSGSSKTVGEEITVMDSRQQNKVMEMTLLYYSDPDAYSYFSKNFSKLFDDYDKMEATELIDYLMDNCMDEYPEIGEIPYEARVLDKPMEKIMDNVLAYYVSPPIDDTEHNLIYVNGAHTSGMWTTLSHEGCPGHMYQNSYFQSTNPKPYMAIRGNLGYMEGWAVYSSYGTLDECDFGGSEYADTLGKLSHINEDLGYLLYGRIDIGVNYEGWNLQQVEDYMVKSGYGTEGAEDVMTTVIGDPGAYLSYTVGYYEMEELRQYAEDELGSKFDAKKYHEAILSCGPCQFENLKTVVDRYIEENR